MSYAARSAPKLAALFRGQNGRPDFGKAALDVQKHLQTHWEFVVKTLSTELKMHKKGGEYDHSTIREMPYLMELLAVTEHDCREAGGYMLLCIYQKLTVALGHIESMMTDIYGRVP